MRSPKILLKGYYGFGNLGDDLLMKIVFDFLRKLFPSAKIDIFSNNLNTVGATGIISASYIPSLIGESVTIVDWTYRGHYDLIIDGGGGVFFSNEKSWHIWKPLNYFFKILGARFCHRLDFWLRLILFKPHHITSKFRFGLGLGVEDFHPYSKEYFSYLVTLGSYTKIYLRDADSYKRVLSLMRRSQIGGHYSDLVFLKTFSASTIDPKKIGIILMDHPAFEEPFFLQHLELQRALEEKGYIVTFYSLDANHDRLYLKTIPGVQVWHPNAGFESFLSTLATCSYIVSCRAHGLVLSAIFGIPSLTLAFRPKLRQISELLGPFNVILDWPASIEKEKGTIMEQLNDIDNFQGTGTVYQANLGRAEEMLLSLKEELLKLTF